MSDRDRQIFDEYIQGSIVVMALGYARHAVTLYHPNTLGMRTKELLRTDGYSEDHARGFVWRHDGRVFVKDEECFPRLLEFIRAENLGELPEIQGLIARLAL